MKTFMNFQQNNKIREIKLFQYSYITVIPPLNIDIYNPTIYILF